MITITDKFLVCMIRDSVSWKNTYNYIDQILSNYYGYNRFNILGGDRNTGSYNQFETDSTSDIINIKMKYFMNKTFIMAGFSNSNLNPLYKKNNICTLSSGEVTNTDAIEIFTNTKDINTSEKAITELFLKYKNEYTIGSPVGIKKAINEIDGNISLVLTDLQYKKVYMYRRNMPIYYHNFNNGDAVIISSDDPWNNNCKYFEKAVMIPNNTGVMIDLDNFSNCIPFKCTSNNQILNNNKSVVAFIPTESNIVLLPDMNNLFNVNQFITTDDIKINKVSNKILEKLTMISNKSESEINDYKFSLAIINYAINNRIANIIIPNIHGDNDRLINILKYITSDLSININIYQLYHRLTNHSDYMEYLELNNIDKLKYHMKFITTEIDTFTNLCRDIVERKLK